MNLTFENPAGMAGCKTAVAPVVFSAQAEIAVGAGNVATVLADIAAGDPAPFGGEIANRGCDDLLVELNYLDGDDCDPCTTPDALVLVPISFVVPAKSKVDLPPGYWQDLQVTTVDTSGAPVANAAEASIIAFSFSKPECPDCKVLAI